MENNNEKHQRSQQGSGSAENRGQDRSRQENKTEDLSKQEKTDIAAKMGKGPNPVGDIEDMGGSSGRDDYAGGFGAGMRDESTGESTER